MDEPTKQNPTASAPISSGGPEHEPIDSHGELIHEVVEHTPPHEVAEHIEVRPETVAIPEELKKAGVEPSGTATFTTIDPRHLPLSDSQIIQAEKASTSSSLRWLAAACIKALKKIHQTLKLIHGKVIRVPSA